MLKLAVFRRSN